MPGGGGGGGGGGVANLLHYHTSQILDKNQDDLSFSYDLQRTTA